MDSPVGNLPLTHQSQPTTTSTTQTQSEMEIVSSSKTPVFHDIEIKVDPSSKRKIAEVWSHATKVRRLDENDTFVGIYGVCNYCKLAVLTDPKLQGNNGIAGHVKRCSSNPSNAINGDYTQQTIAQSTCNSIMTTHIFNQKRLEDKVVRFIIRDEMPFRFVEGGGFIEMMNDAQPRFKILNRRKVASLVWELYLMEADKIKSIIGDQRVSITTDTWTSIQNINYMAITAHFLDNEYKLHKRIINFTKITSHKGVDIGKVLEACLNKWGIDKVFTITVDNASANDKAVEYMEKKLDDMGTLLFKGKYLHMRCCCHIVNLIVKSGLKYLRDSIDSIRNCVKYIHSSGSRLDQFREFAILLKMDKMSTVPLDVTTRWNSTYTMLDVAYKFKKVFTRMKENIQFVEYFEEEEGPPKNRTKRKGPPGEIDWENTRGIMSFLKRFYDTTLKLSATKTATMPLIWQEIYALQNNIRRTMADPDRILQDVARHMDIKFRKYWGNIEKINHLVFLGHILDPRHKLQLLEINLDKMNVDALKIQSFIRGLWYSLLELYHLYKGNDSLGSFDNIVEDGEFDNDLMETYKDDPATLESYKEMAQLRKSQNQVEITNKVDKYFSDPFVKWCPNFDILQWWKGNTTALPVLSKIAKDIFAIPSSSVSSENAFSLGRRIVDPFRASLQPKMVEALVCTSDWLRGETINLYKEPTKDELEFYMDCEEVVTSNTHPM